MDDLKYQEILNKLKESGILFNEKKFEKVYKFAIEKYQDKKRYSDILVIDHALGVTCEVIDMHLDEASVYAAMLHETIKIGDFNPNEISNIAGNEVLDMIEHIHRLSSLNYGSKEAKNAETLRNMFMSIAKDVRCVIIKLIDRLYNMRNIDKFDDSYKDHMAKESLYIYAPIAHRLGMAQLRSELEDISFRVLFNKEYHEIKAEIDEKKKDRQDYIEKRIGEIKEILEKEHIEATIYGRPKHFYSIYRKMKDKNCKAEDLYDLLAIRIIVNSVKDCYSVLGFIHDMYKPLPGRFKDYIAVPKTNMYQSLHTTVFGEKSRPFEVQIRTWDMHRVADYGIAAHFIYKEHKDNINEEDKKIVWLRQIIEMQKDVLQSTENISKLKTELFGEEVFVFTPKGDIISLPKGSTTIDFAYAIHQKVGEKMIGAKINSKMVPISTKLQNTDIVEIITQEKSEGPKVDWLQYVRTTSAKNKITSFLKKKNETQNITKGKEILERELRHLKVPKEFYLKEENIAQLLERLNYNTIDECYENIGFGSVTSKKIAHKMFDIYAEKNIDIEEDKIAKTTQSNYDKQGLINVKGLDNCLVKFARCCNPIPGDKITGYITYSNGISIHRCDCNNLGGLDTLNRTIDVSWKGKSALNFETKISIYANTCETVLTDIIIALKNMKITVKDINSKNTQDRQTIINVTINVPSNEKLVEVMRNLKKVDSVFEVKRTK